MIKWFFFQRALLLVAFFHPQWAEWFVARQEWERKINKVSIIVQIGDSGSLD